MTAREAILWLLLRAFVFAFIMINYWEPLPGIAWFMLFVAFTGPWKIKLT